MFSFSFIDKFDDLQLDIVGIVAVLGEGCTSRVINASALSWHHLLPRFLPAPQALLRHERRPRLPVGEGMVIGAYSGNCSKHLNFFCELLHPEPPKRNSVELLRVLQVKKHQKHHRRQAFGVPPFGWLAGLSILGFLLAVAMIVLSIIEKDGFAFVATILLACTSSIVGLASWWELDFREEKAEAGRSKTIPDSDVVIAYPNGSFRIIKCKESVARLYFKTEICIPFLGDDSYRAMALISSVTLMMGLLCMGNAKTICQAAFAAAYISLNVIYWAVSALNPKTRHWRHGYRVKEIEFHPPTEDYQPRKQNARARKERSRDGSRATTSQVGFTGVAEVTSENTAGISHISQREGKELYFGRQDLGTDIEANESSTRYTYDRRNLVSTVQSYVDQVKTVYNWVWTWSIAKKKEEKRFAEALWTAVALTGSSRWIRDRQLAPDTDAWSEWLKIAEKKARPRKNRHGQDIPACEHVGGQLYLPIWNYKRTFDTLLKQEQSTGTRRPPFPPTTSEKRQIDPSDIKPNISNRLKRWRYHAQTRLDNGEQAKPIKLNRLITIKLKAFTEALQKEADTQSLFSNAPRSSTSSDSVESHLKED